MTEALVEWVHLKVQRQEGLHKLAPRPLGDSSNLIVSLWERHSPGSRSQEDSKVPLSPEAERKLVEHLNSFAKAPTALGMADIPSEELENVAIERLVPAKKGSWWLIPKRVADSEGCEKA